MGYVGAPLAFALAQNYDVIGFDVNATRIQQLQVGEDTTGELDASALGRTASMVLTCDADSLASADVFIVTVPTPVNEGHVPDMGFVCRATETVARHMRRGALVVYESTVYPGATEEVCLPILQKVSGLHYPEDFSIGYSPERINPGDTVHTLYTTTKIVSGDRPQVVDQLASIYGSITKVHKAPTIKVAEAAKILENTQRDVNIAVMNEVSQIFSRLGVDTYDVLEAAGTKWNFLPFTPGLVGGHCISVDPYYLSHKAAVEGYPAKLILAARETNDSMGGFLANLLIKRLAREKLFTPDVTVTILGATFKENCPDIRNSKVVDIYNELTRYGIKAQVVDPHADAEEFEHEYGITLTSAGQARGADAVLLAVPHRAFAQQHGGFEGLVEDYARKDGKVLVMDLKAALDRTRVADRFNLWRP